MLQGLAQTFFSLTTNLQTHLAPAHPPSLFPNLLLEPILTLGWTQRDQEVLPSGEGAVCVCLGECVVSPFITLGLKKKNSVELPSAHKPA